MSKMRILFVDDEPNLLNGLKRVLRPMRREWDMGFADSGQKALDLFKEDPFEVVVTDMRMPEMNGVQLLTKIMGRYPRTVRIALSGQAEQELLMEAVKVSHQYLTKPCELDELKSTILSGSALSHVIANVDELPSLPSVYQELMEAVRSPDISLSDIGEIISRDMGMTTKILRLINSAYFGLRAEITDIPRSVSLLGLETIKSLVLGIQIFSQLDEKKIPKGFIESLWSHSMTTGTFAKAIAQNEELGKDIADQAFVAGLLHDLGKIMFASNLTDQYREVIDSTTREGIPFTEAELQIIGTTHSEVGMYLAGLWGLDAGIIQAVAFHHNPEESHEMKFGSLTAVHVANVLDHANKAAGKQTGSVIDTEYLSAVEKADRLPVWKKICQEVE